MPTELSTSPALVLSLALAAGIVSQILARHLRVPGIVVLLAAGVLLGPEVLGVLDPTALGHGMHDVVGFAVAVILFEGGLNVDIRRLRREALSIRRLLTIGALEVAVQGPTGESLAQGLVSPPLSLGAGALPGLAGGGVLTLLLRPRFLVPEGMQNTFSLAWSFVEEIGVIPGESS